MANPRAMEWWLSRDLWRLSSRMPLSWINWFMRVLGAHRMPPGMMDRFFALGIPQETVELTLKSIRSIDDWSLRWVETAQQYLGTYRRETSAGNRVEAENARFLAAMSYQAAQILEFNDIKTRDNCRAWSASLFRQSLATRNPNARHFTIPWRDQELPLLFEVPEQGSGPFGLVILLNGVSHAKEETFAWAPRFLAAGYAVIAIDSPGTGEATSLGIPSASNIDILDGIFDLLQHEDIIDLDRVVLVGGSLGGNEALRIARRMDRIMALVTVTPAVVPSRWITHASPLLRAEFASIIAMENLESEAKTFDTDEFVADLKQPILVFGAARDMVVPPAEAGLLAEMSGDRATLIWYSSLGHCLYSAVDQWTWEAASWITAVGEARAVGITDGAELSGLGRAAIEAGEYHPSIETDQDWEDDDVGEYARLLTPEEIEH